MPSGGSADAITHSVGAPLSQVLGQPMIFENRAGTDSLIAAETVRTVAERIPYRRGHPDKPNYDVPNSVALHSNRPLLSLTTTSMTGIAYIAEGPLLSDLVAGRLHASFILE